MRDNERATDREHDAAASHHPETSAAAPSDDADQYDPFDESLTEELAALIDDGRTYAQAELAFQKTRAKLAGKSIGLAVAFVVVAIITLHIAVLALAVGLVIALQPLVTIWGAIAIVVGMLVLITGMLGWAAKGQAGRLSMIFGSEDEN